MADLATHFKSVVLPDVQGQGSQAGTSTRSTPREPSTPRSRRGRPSAGKWLQYDVPNAASSGPSLVGPSLVQNLGGRHRQALTLNELPEIKKLVSGVCPPRPGRGTSGRRMGESITAPELPGLDLAISEAMSDLMSDCTSTTDATNADERAPGKEWSLQRVNAIASEDDWAPLLLDAFFRPVSELSRMRGDEEVHMQPPDLEDCKKMLRSVLPPEPPPQQPRANPGQFNSEPSRPSRPRDSDKARPSCAGRSLSARGRRPRSASS